MDISIIIVSWNVRDFLKNCLASIYKQTTNLDFEVFVVDNNSQDGSSNMVAKFFPDVQIMANKKNIGFAKACNQAIKKSSGDFILLLNPDTEIIDNSIAKTWDFIKQTPKAGIVGCRVVNQDKSVQSSVRAFPSFMSHILIMLKLHHYLPRNKFLRKYYMKDFDYNKTQIVDQVMGAFYMIKRELFKQVGLLDQHFFIWYEEVDLCQRAKKNGWHTYYFSQAEIMHHGAQSFVQIKPVLKQAIFNRSMLYYFFKHHSFFEYLLLLILYPISLILASIVQIIKLKKKNVR